MSFEYYKFIKPILFKIDPELAHSLSLKTLKVFSQLNLLNNKLNNKKINIMGLDFNNPIGLAPGIDKDGEFIKPLSDLGMGFIELGGVTVNPQPGHPKPRLFRIPEQASIINRMGFNNKGVDNLVNNLKNIKYKKTILGVNIAKSMETPLEQAIDDFKILFEKLYNHCDFITVNLSSPNTPNLRKLQTEDYLDNLLQNLKNIQINLPKYTPLLIKIAPDLNSDEIKSISQNLLKNKIDGLIATNTSLDRTEITNPHYKNLQGGLSGKLIQTKSTQIIKNFSKELDNQIPIIGVGGIDSIESAQAKFQAGASLIQLYSGLIYKGPGLLKELIEM